MEPNCNPDTHCIPCTHKRPYFQPHANRGYGPQVRDEYFQANIRGPIGEEASGYCADFALAALPLCTSAV